MIGLVVGLLCILVVAGLCSACFDLDVEWYNTLILPNFVLTGGYFTLFTLISYTSSLLTISRLVEFKHLFPSMLYFLILGISCILFMLFFFKLKIIWTALVFITIAAMISYVLFIRFLGKEIKMALEFLPTLAFNIYSLLCVLAIFMNN